VYQCTKFNHHPDFSHYKKAQQVFHSGALNRMFIFFIGNSSTYEFPY